MGLQIDSHGKLNTNFHDNKIPQENECYICFSALSLDSVVKVGKTIVRKYF